MFSKLNIFKIANVVLIVVPEIILSKPTAVGIVIF